jgi:hypothetical protein
VASTSIVRARFRKGFRRSAARLRRRARSFLGQYPSVYLPFARWKRRRYLRTALEQGIVPEAKAPVDRDTDAVIEGFPRSANTFAATAFALAQPNSVRVARHLHVPSQVIFAAKRGIPTMVLIRPPEDAVASLIVRAPILTPKEGLKEYVRFYRRILPHRRRFVVATFDEVSTDFGQSIRRLNERFGTSFWEFDHTSEAVARCFKIMEEHERDRSGDVLERRVARPSKQREPLKDSLRTQMRSRELARLRSEAYQLYGALTSS